MCQANIADQVEITDRFGLDEQTWRGQVVDVLESPERYVIRPEAGDVVASIRNAEDVELIEKGNRQNRAELLARVGAVSEDGRAGRYHVESQNGDGTYEVDLDAGTCTCPDHVHRGARCKHIRAARIHEDAHADEGDVYSLAREIVETEGQWYSGQSRTVWAGDTHSVVVQEYGRDGGGLLGLQIHNGSDSELVECGHLSVGTGRWLWTLSRSEYESWVEKARSI